MRKLCALAALVAAVVVPTAGAAAHKVVVTLSPSTVKVLYGHHVTLSGRVYGKAPGAAVTLLAWHHGASSPVKVAVTHTNAKGRYTFKVLPARQTKYKVRDAAILSHAVTVGVEPSLALKEMGDGRISAHVAPAHAMAGKFVELEQLRGGVWVVIHKSKLSKSGATTFGPLSGGTVRLAMSVNEAGAGYLGALSHAMTYRALQLTLQPDSFKVLYGHSTMLRGRLWNGQAGQTIRIREWRFGHSAPVTLASVRTGAHGVWSLRIAPRVLTSYQAQWTSLHVSARERVGVAPAISIARLSGDRIATHVSAGRSFAGRTVIVQRQVAPGVWVKVAQATLNHNSSAVIPLTVPASTLRVAMSINEAGAGFLAGVSRALVYKP